MNPRKNKKIRTVKIINKLFISKIVYKTCYKNNIINHLTKFYFEDRKQRYYLPRKTNKFSVGDMVKITCIKYKNCNKRYIKNIDFFTYY